ncbi:fibronectin type 3 and ankyrin repeat domains protein 1-like [Myxocyprinus asiaticus]|uniref:fibronectin type 3 and ankyrin repeat domains protein 1-like n=1 Tax=Myxocyprinus asiaticus TaxID=70543 RepID=UPI0022224EA7|nr:fibronectin type 3 and ankyrin repeat domains protein 1-like [Myxocyprinus asiaticus]
MNTSMQTLSLELPQPPVIGKVSHHSIELSWINEDRKRQDGPPECWTSFSVEQMDTKTDTYRTIYIGYGTHHIAEGLKPSTSYSFRLRVTKPSGLGCLSPAVSVFTTREPFSGRNLHQAVSSEDVKGLTIVLQSG